MQPAPELEQVVLRFYEALSRRDGDLAEKLTSREAGAVFMGTDPDECLEDTASLRQLVQVQARAGVTVAPDEVRAYREGSVGWIADRGAFRLADGTEVPFRLPAVFHEEDGDWKLVQEHASIGVSNEQAIGEDLGG